MEQLTRLISVIDRLLGPEGCPWDREQTLRGCRHHLIEEAYELIEAIDSGASDSIVEELGDLLFLALFLVRLAEKELHGDLNAVAAEVSDKLIRRHPHVFELKRNLSEEEINVQWESIKRSEKEAKGKKKEEKLSSAFPALERAQQFYDKKNAFDGLSECPVPHFSGETDFGDYLLQLVAIASQNGWRAELALQAAVSRQLNHANSEKSIGKDRSVAGSSSK